MLRIFGAAVAIVTIAATGAARAALTDDAVESVDAWLGHDGAIALWSGDVRIGELAAVPVGGGRMLVDPSVEVVQFPSTAFPSQLAQSPVEVDPQTLRPSSGSFATGGLAGIPYMLGDAASAPSVGFQGLLQAELVHPSLVGGRLNVADANSPLPADRVYYSYRHFANATRISAFQASESSNVDQHLVAWENAFWDGTGSVEFRVPIEHRLRSDFSSVLASEDGLFDPIAAPGDGRRGELGNVALVFKILLCERPTYAISGGLGISLPTARDVTYHVDAAGEATYPSLPGVAADAVADVQAVFANETVYLSPYLAWVVAPPRRWFHQGFLQVETAANPSRVTLFGEGTATFSDASGSLGSYSYHTPIPVQTEIFAQPLLRLNLGWGYILAERHTPRRSSTLAGLFELHYTTTLDDANLSNVPITTLAASPSAPVRTITVGNGFNRVDLLNMATGLSGQFGPWAVANGILVPIQPFPDRGFDFEYNLQVQRLF